MARLLRIFSISLTFCCLLILFSKAVPAQTLKLLTARDWLKQGIVMGKKGDFDKAIECFNRAIEINPHFDKALQNRGIAWIKKGDFKRALSDFDAALSINPRNTTASYYRRIAIEKSGVKLPIGRPEKQLDDEDWLKKGIAHSQNNNFDKAIADFNVAIDINPLFTEAYKGRGIAWDKKGVYDRAIEDYG